MQTKRVAFEIEMTTACGLLLVCDSASPKSVALVWAKKDKLMHIRVVKVNGQVMGPNHVS